MSYPVFDISGTDQDLFEQLETNIKFWFANERKLYKEGRANTGENWAEVVASRICDLLLIPMLIMISLFTEKMRELFVNRLFQAAVA